MFKKIIEFLLGNSAPAERFPESDFVIGGGTKDGMPAIASINRAYKRYSYCSDYPWHVQIEIFYTGKNEEGQPSADEAPILLLVEQDIDTKMRAVCVVHLIAGQNWNGIRMLDYYLDNGDAAREVLERLQMVGQHQRKFKFTVELDDAWSLCKGFFMHM